jgi:hypothetical protein
MQIYLRADVSAKQPVTKREGVKKRNETYEQWPCGSKRRGDQFQHVPWPNYQWRTHWPSLVLIGKLLRNLKAKFSLSLQRQEHVLGSGSVDHYCGIWVYTGPGREIWRFRVVNSSGDGGAGRSDSLTLNSWKYAISVDMEQWTAEHRTFVRETFSRHNELSDTIKWHALLCIMTNNTVAYTYVLTSSILIIDKNS